MTSEPLGMLADIAAAIVIMFILPLMCVTGMSERLADRYLRGTAEQFVEAVCSRGYIDESLYEAFLSRIAGVGGGRQVGITETIPRYEPVYVNNVFTGEISEFSEIRGTEEILAGIYSENGYDGAADAGICVEIYDGKAGLVRCSGTVKGRAKR